MASRITPNGTVLDTAGIYLSTDTAGFPAVAFDGTNYLVVWADRNSGLDNFDIRAVRVSTAGQVLDPNGITISGADSIQARPALAYGGGRYLTLWQDARQKGTFRYDIYAARVLTSGVVQDPQGIAVRKSIPGQQICPAIAFDGTNYLAVWQDARNVSFPQPDYDIYGIRIDPVNGIIDTAPLPIITGISGLENPGISFGATRYLMVNKRNNKIYGVFIQPTGAATDTFLIATNVFDFNPNGIAFGDTTFYVTWMGVGGNAMGCRITQSGRVMDPSGIILDTTTYYCYAPVVCFGNGNCLAVWSCYYYGINSRRIAEDGTLFDPQLIQINPDYYYDLALDYNGNLFFLIWTIRVNIYNDDIYGCRINQSGVPMDTNAIVICNNPGWQYDASVKYDGTNFILVWVDGGDSISFDLNGAKVSPQGQVVSRFPVVALPMDQYEPALARSIGDRILLTYTGWTERINIHPAGMDRIWGKMYPFTEVTENSALRQIGFDFLIAQPNPFRNRIDIKYDLGIAREAKAVELKIYDVTGRLIRRFSEPSAGGRQLSAINWDGMDQDGRKVPAGVYFIHLAASGRELSRKIILLK